MNRLILDGKKVETLMPQSLPMLIHGGEGSGASLYTICLAAKWFDQGRRVLFLCGYPMAEEEFAAQVDRAYTEVRFYTKEKIEAFKQAIAAESLDGVVVFVKNVELFGIDLFECVSGIDKLVLSGDFNRVGAKEKLLKREFATQIFFSSLGGHVLPPLNKYEGYVVSGDYQGITKLS